MTQYETRSQTQTETESKFWPRYFSLYSDFIRAEQYGDRIPVWANFFAPVQTGPGAHPSSCTMCTGSLLKLIISVGIYTIPVFIIKDSSTILILVCKRIQTCQFLTPKFLLSTFTGTVIMLVHCSALPYLLTFLLTYLFAYLFKYLLT